MDTTIDKLNDANITYMTPGKAHETAAALNADKDDDCTYVVNYVLNNPGVVRPNNAFISVYDADGHFGINL